MPDFTHRSYAKELLDADDIPFADIAQNMRELDVINHRLGGHRITVKGFKNILERKKAFLKNTVSVVEIGCGGGDNLRVLQHWAEQKNITLQLCGIDINEACIAYAQKQSKEIEFICSDYKNVAFDQKPHIVFSSLFCHHFTDDEIVYQLRWMQQNAAAGFFINDLHRHPLAYYSIKAITQLFSRSYLVKNDAPLSVRRGFVRQDWQRLLQQAGITNHSCRWQWAFRWLITSINEHAKGKSNI